MSQGRVTRVAGQKPDHDKAKKQKKNEFEDEKVRSVMRKRGAGSGSCSFQDTQGWNYRNLDGNIFIFTNR